MNPPFTVAQFLDVFARYNAAIWPAQIVAYALGLAVIGALLAGSPGGSSVVLAVLVLMWAWTAIGHHLTFFAAINPIAPVFAAAFLIEVLLLAVAALRADRVAFEVDGRARSAIALGIIGYALLVYPLLGIRAGHGLMSGPMFGVAPCPTTIFTIGILILARGRWVIGLAIIPLLWAVIGTAAALQFGIVEDFGLAVAAVALTVFLARDLRERRAARLVGSQM